MLNLTDKAWYNHISSRSVTKTYQAGEAIHFQDEMSEHVGVVMSGRAKAVSYSENGTETWLGRFSEGEFFGHISLLTEKPVNFEISAETDISALIIPVKAMREMLNENGDISSALIKDLALRLDLMTRRLVEALTLSAKGRVCAELMRLSNPIGIDPEKHIIRPNPIFVELALRISSSRETVSRTVSELQKKGIVSREPGALIIQNTDRLKAAIQ
ncbi:Crp/Fnr family transcriptional regulator [Hellea sp.]|nr:Crp/Fnr family transcriptional regulator [Hellea sp.]